MANMFGFVLCGLVLGVLTCCVKAEMDELEKKFVMSLAECWEEFNLTSQDLEVIKVSKKPETENLKCYLACAYKKSGMMTGKGEFFVEGVRKASIEGYGSDEKTLKKIDEFIDICKKVNDVAVPDGEKGCERAALMFECSNEHAANFEK